jgi:hypothetical protein
VRFLNAADLGDICVDIYMSENSVRYRLERCELLFFNLVCTNNSLITRLYSVKMIIRHEPPLIFIIYFKKCNLECLPINLQKLINLKLL